MNDDFINHPSHYVGQVPGIECIQVSEHFNFNLGNAIKYIWRVDSKDDPLVNLEKAIWYLQREIKRRSTPPHVVDDGVREQQDEELKPCPFCGATDAEVHDGLGCDEQYTVICFSCGCSASYCDEAAEAIAAWNRRAK